MKIQAESDIGPSLVLPSISEDDENQTENEVKRVSGASPSKSPARSPRHGKFLQRYLLIGSIVIFAFFLFSQTLHLICQR